MIIPDPLEAKIKSFIDEGKALHGIASWLVNLEIHKHVSMDLEDLADTAVVADEIGTMLKLVNPRCAILPSRRRSLRMPSACT